jgi:beta-galactosidase
MAGANSDGKKHSPDVTSYDYGAPLNEYGEPTPKYFAFRDVIRKHIPGPDLPLPTPTPRKAFGTVELKQSTSLMAQLDRLSKPVQNAFPLTMEALGQSYGFILYRTRVDGPREKAQLILQECHDRALVFVDGVYKGVIDRNGMEPAIELEFGAGSFQLDILVESQARTNYGPWLHDRKGITEGARFGYLFLFDWTMHPLPLDAIRKVDFKTPAAGEGPVFHRGTFTVDEPADTFLAFPGWTKGVAWLNGFNLGRYWEEKGPQKTLYVPAPLLKKGRNELIVLELHKTAAPRVEFRDAADLG